MLRGSLRGRDYQLTCELDPSNWKLLIPSPVLGMYVLPTLPMAGVSSRVQP